MLTPPISWRTALLALSCTCVLAARAAAQEDPPRFVAGELTDLYARVLRAEEVSDQPPLCLATVRVDNRGAHWAEPLIFECATPETDWEPVRQLERVLGPHYGRAGRAVPPRSSAEFPLVLPLEARGVRSALLSITRASFFDLPEGAPPPRLVSEAPRVEIEIGERDSFLDRDIGQSVRRTVLHTRSAEELELDVVLRARYRRPLRAETLIVLRVRPGEEQTHELTGFPLARRDASLTGADIERVELVDWSVRWTDGAELAAELFAAAYERGARYGAERPSFTGRFRFEHVPALVEQSARGRFWWNARDGLRLQPEPDFEQVDTGEAVRAMERALSPLLRPAVEAALDEGRPSLWTLQPPIVRLESASWQPWKGAVHYELSNQHLSRRYWDADDQRARTVWRWSRQGDDWLRTGWAEYQSFDTEVWEEVQVDWQSVQGVPFPRGLGILGVKDFEGRRERLSLELTQVRLDRDGLAPLEVPEGPLADRVREQWESFYAYPDEAASLSGQFDIRLPGTDGVWLGERRVRGQFSLHGFRGTRWSLWDIDVETDRSREDAQALASALEDRLRLFVGRELGGREPFDVAFAGARLQEEEDGVVRIEGGPFPALRLGEERLQSVFVDAEIERRFSWRRLGGEWVPSAIETAGERIEYDWARLGDGWFWPRRVEMIEVFGDDWGPERLSLDKLEVGD